MIDNAAESKREEAIFRQRINLRLQALGSISPCDMPSFVVAICSGWLERVVLQATLAYQSVGNRLCTTYT